MLYINQREYPHIPYRTDMEHPDGYCATSGTIKDSGCGICSAMMMVDRLCMESLSMEEGIQMSYECGANMEPGTDMIIFGKALAERFGLSLEMTDSLEELNASLASGGCTIVNVGGNREGHKGIFSRVGHYMVILSYENGYYKILDPDWVQERYEGSIVRQEGKILYAPAEAILADTANRSPAFYMFK